MLLLYAKLIDTTGLKAFQYNMYTDSILRLVSGLKISDGSEEISLLLRCLFKDPANAMRTPVPFHIITAKIYHDHITPDLLSPLFPSTN